MQQCALIVVLALSALQLAASLSAANEARLFLRNHVSKQPHQDELAELNKENPEAYALVKALLTKRSLGLLNSKHPTASFSPEAPQAPEQGPEVFSNMLRPGELEEAHVQHRASAVQQSAQVTLPYADVQPAKKDWMSWKPQDSALNDDQMVANVLGAVAELKGGKKAGLLSKRRDSGDSPLANDEASFAVEAPTPPKPVAAAPVSHENSYLKSIDFGIRTPEEAEQPVKPKENSYLKNFNLDSDTPQAAAPVFSAALGLHPRTSQVQASNALSSFSWDDDKPKEQPKPKVAAQPEVKGPQSTLLSWLGVVKPAAPPQAAPAEDAKPKNPYMMDLS